MKNTKIFIFLLFYLKIFTLHAQEVKKIELLNADFIDYDEQLLGKEIKRLTGNVAFKHDNAVLKCDSAYFNSLRNNVVMYSHVHINFGDTIDLWGDSIRYYGNTKIAQVRNNVKLKNKNAILTTDSMNYDRNLNMGYYFNWGKIKDGDNSLVSKWGYYFALLKDFVAVKNVILTNPKYHMYSDSLRYNIQTELTSFYGPSKIVGDSNLIYCENGWYNTKTEISQFNKNAYLISKAQTIKADSLYYDRNKGYGKAYKNVEIIDTSANIILLGNFGYYYESPEQAMLTDSAVFINFNNNDSLFLHADTLRTNTLTDSIGIYKLTKAYNHVKLFKTDMQGSCDSLTYSFRDSIIKLFNMPVMWSEVHQLTAKIIEIHTKNNEADYIVLQDAAFIISQEDTIRFNQIKGKNMIGYIKDKELMRIEVDGNGESVYFPKDNNELIGANKAESSKMTIYLDEGKVSKILFLTKPTAVLHPIDELPATDLLLANFHWYKQIRPMKKEDIFSK
ncbi:MAG: organic solvent tolerance protein OstA [Bacteroidetes bacterium CG23_combo_of_CG06-09_8_20_14_all_32_9]|nr:MAG: organic solvent tolerance protein OstA [Bacteroidetes bacterium CG23_combo_of_CG06-09_8_20_14_all_32_9]